jgi:hypothetical protein
MITIEENDDRFYIKESTMKLAGKGLFAKRKIKLSNEKLERLRWFFKHIKNVLNKVISYYFFFFAFVYEFHIFLACRSDDFRYH